MSEPEPFVGPFDATVQPSSLPRGYVVVDPSLAARLRSEHTRTFEVEAVATPTGQELLTRDLPNLSEVALSVLDEEGLAKVGTEVRPGTLLVGKVTPTGGELPSPEEKLLRAIFGEQPGEVRDSSLRAPPGCHGTVTAARREGLGDGLEARATVEVSWQRPLEVGDVLRLDEHEVVVAAIEPLGAELAWSGGASSVAVSKVALARDRLHARSIGPYSSVTQQPLQGREQFGGQPVSREQLEILATHAPWAAWELLTIKADDVVGRTRAYEALVRQENPNVVPRAVEPSPAAPAAAGMRDIFSFFEAPKGPAPGEVPAVRPEAVEVMVAHLRAMGLELELGKAEVVARLRSSQEITTASFGEVRKPETLSYRTLSPEPGGLFCSRIFGPVKDYECACGKYKRMKHRGIVCEDCGVEVIASKVRRERFGHVALANPCLHPLLVGAVACLLGHDEDELRRLVATDRVRYDGERFSAVEGDEDGELGGRVLWEVLRSLDLEAIDATEAGPRADLAGALVDAGVPATALMLEVVPVLPPDLRPLVPVGRGWATSHLNDLYRRLINRNNRLVRLMELHAPAIIIANEHDKLQEAVDQLMINGALPRPVTNPEGVPLRALAQATDDVLAQRVFTKAVDYSGVAHLSVDPSLSAGECRVPASMLVELFKPRAFGILEERGYVATIKSAKRSIEEERPEGLAAIEEASEGFPGLLMAGSAVVCRRLRRWDAPAIAVDPSTAERLGAREVALHVPVMHEAALQVTRLPDLPGAPSHASAGWLVHAGHTGALVRAAFEAAIAGERDGLDDPVVALALGRVPIDPDARELERWVEWDRDRRAGVRAWVVAREGELGPPDASTSPHLDRSLDELELSVRTSVALHSAGLSTVRELCRMTEADLLRTKNLGRRSLKEIEEILLEMGLSLRMTDV